MRFKKKIFAGVQKYRGGGQGQIVDVRKKIIFLWDGFPKWIQTFRGTFFLLRNEVLKKFLAGVQKYRGGGQGEIDSVRKKADFFH